MTKKRKWSWKRVWSAIPGVLLVAILGIVAGGSIVSMINTRELLNRLDTLSSASQQMNATCDGKPPCLHIDHANRVTMLDTTYKPRDVRLERAMDVRRIGRSWDELGDMTKTQYMDKQFDSGGNGYLYRVLVRDHPVLGWRVAWVCQFQRVSGTCRNVNY